MSGLATGSDYSCSHPDSHFDRTLCAAPCNMMHSYCTECGECVDPCPHKATPSSGVTEGKAESGELDPALVERCAGAAYELEQLLGGTPWESVIRRNWAYQQDIYDKWTGIARAVLAAAQPPAPESPDAATVLAGLVDEIENLRQKYLRYSEYSQEYGHDSGHRAEGVRDALLLVRAAQQRLADRGRGGGSDEAEVYEWGVKVDGQVIGYEDREQDARHAASDWQRLFMRRAVGPWLPVYGSSEKPRCRAIIDLGPGVRGFKICALDPDHEGRHDPGGSDV